MTEPVEPSASADASTVEREQPQPTTMPAELATAAGGPSTSGAWRAARVLLAVAAVAYFVAAMVTRFSTALSPLSLDGDQHQSIGQFWRFAIDGAMPRGHLFSDYAFAYHAPPFWWVVMAAGSSILGPLTTAKLLGLLAYALFAVGACVVVARRTDWVLGLLVAILVLRNSHDQITGGMARSMGPALVFLFMYAFIEKRDRLVLLTLILQAGIYPSVVIPCGITYGIYALVKGPMKERLKRCGELTVAGVLVIGLGLAQDFRSADWWGETVTYEEAMKMPQWRRGGRFEEVPHRAFDDALINNLNRSFKPNGPSFAPEAVQQFYARHPQMSFVGIPFALAVLGLLAAAVRRRMAPASAAAFSTDRRNHLPWEWFALFGGAIAAYWLVRLVSFKLFLPSRQLGFSIQFIVVTGLPVLVWLAVKRLRPRSEWLPVAVAALVTVVPAFLVQGHGLTKQRMSYSDRRNEAKFYDAIHRLPLDQEVACDIRQCEVMMALGRHMPYAAKNLSHPLRLGFYAEAERRLIEMNRAFFATTVDEMKNFVERENVHYFIYDSRELKEPHKSLYNPVKQKVTAIFRAGRNKPRLLAKPPKEAIVFQEGSKLIVDLDKLIAHAPAVAEPVESASADKPAVDANTPTLRQPTKIDALKRLPMLKQ